MFVVARLSLKGHCMGRSIKWYRYAVVYLPEGDKSSPLRGSGPPITAWENHSRCIPNDCPMALLDCAGRVKGPVLANPGNSPTYLKFTDGMANAVVFGFDSIDGRRDLSRTSDNNPDNGSPQTTISRSRSGLTMSDNS
jgi:hypothetical protein